jgi:hypothetical protein
MTAYRDQKDIIRNGVSLASVLADHQLWLRGEGGKRADLSGWYLACANMTDANMTGANMTDAIMTGANMTGACLWGAIGNMREIKSMQIEGWPVTYTADTLQIGCKRHPIAAWRNASPDWIKAMHSDATDWWAKFGPLILAVIDASPATPTGHDR